MCYYVYILYSKSMDSYYKGQTNNLVDRIKRHNSGQEKATKHGIPWDLVWNTKKSSRSEAVILETKLKNLSKGRIVKFISRHMGIVAGPDVTPRA
jgi:putative endonuclease